MEYFLEKTVKFQRHIGLTNKGSLLSYLKEEQIDSDILKIDQTISVISKNGIYIELNLAGTLMLEGTIKGKNINEIANDLSEIFDEEIATIENDTKAFLDTLTEKGYMIKLCLV